MIAEVPLHLVTAGRAPISASSTYCSLLKLLTPTARILPNECWSASPSQVAKLCSRPSLRHLSGKSLRFAQG